LYDFTGDFRFKKWSRGDCGGEAEKVKIAFRFGPKNVKQYQIPVSGVLYFMPNQFSQLQR
jgi:hypothetical protein